MESEELIKAQKEFHEKVENVGKGLSDLEKQLNDFNEQLLKQNQELINKVYN